MDIRVYSKEEQKQIVRDARMMVGTNGESLAESTLCWHRTVTDLEKRLSELRTMKLRMLNAVSLSRTARIIRGFLLFSSLWSGEHLYLLRCKHCGGTAVLARDIVHNDTCPVRCGRAFLADWEKEFSQ